MWYTRGILHILIFEKSSVFPFAALQPMEILLPEGLVLHPNKAMGTLAPETGDFLPTPLPASSPVTPPSCSLFLPPSRSSRENLPILSFDHCLILGTTHIGGFQG